MVKERIVIDVYNTEDENDEFYRVQSARKTLPKTVLRATGFTAPIPIACDYHGIFVSKDELDEWLSDHIDEIEVAADWRRPEGKPKKSYA